MLNDKNHINARYSSFMSGQNLLKQTYQYKYINRINITLNINIYNLASGRPDKSHIW